MRAAAADFRTARLLGVRANAVISLAVLLSGVIAAIVAVVMTVETPYVTVRLRAARHDHRARRRRRRRDRPAVERDARRLRDRLRDGPARTASCRASAPGRSRAASTSTPPCSHSSSSCCSCGRTACSCGVRAARWSAYDASERGRAARSRRAARARRPRRQLPDGRRARSSSRTRSIFAAIVVALYVFVGNSGVLSFGQIGFFIVGAYAAGELTVPADAKQSVLPAGLLGHPRPLRRQRRLARARRRGRRRCSRSSSAFR